MATIQPQDSLTCVAFDKTDEPGAEDVDIGQLRKELASAKNDLASANETLSKMEDKLGPDPEDEPEEPPCCIARISIFGPSVWGGVLTILFPLAAAGYLYFLIISLIDVEDYISFLEVGVVSDLPDLQTTFTCSAPPGCRACTLPCTGGTTIVDIAAGESAVLVMPFFVIQNAYFKILDYNYELGLTSVAQRDPTKDSDDNPLDLQVAQASPWWNGVPIGHITGPTGAGEPIAVALHRTPPFGSTSSKTIVTSKTLLDGTDEVAYAPDGSDCAKAELTTCSDLMGHSVENQLLLPPIARNASQLMSAVKCYCTTVCSASFYIKTEVVEQDLGYMVLISLVFTSMYFVKDIFGQTARGFDIVHSICSLSEAGLDLFSAILEGALGIVEGASSV